MVLCELIKSSVRTDKDFKEVYLTIIVKALFDHYGAEVTSTEEEVRVRWLYVSRIRNVRELNGVSQPSSLSWSMSTIRGTTRLAHCLHPCFT
jgi:hypothetical protein